MIVDLAAEMGGNCEATEPEVPTSGAPYAELKDLQECIGVARPARELLAAAAAILHEPGLALPGPLPGIWPLLILGEGGRRVHANLPRRREAAEVRALRRTGFYVLPGDTGDVMLLDGESPPPGGSANTFGYELSVGKPRVLTKEIDGAVCEPIEYLVVETPPDTVGSVMELVGNRRGLDSKAVLVRETTQPARRVQMVWRDRRGGSHPATCPAFGPWQRGCLTNSTGWPPVR